MNKQQIAERIARITRDEHGDALPIDVQAELVAELVKNNRRDALTDKLKALTDPVDVPPAPPEAQEPGSELAVPIAQQVAILDHDRLELLRRTLANDLSDDEFAIFAAQCNLRRLDPFANQIHAVVRTSDGERKMAVQTGIDGFRVIADRTNCYAGSDDPMYEGEIEYGTGQNKGIAPMRATVTVRKIVQGQVFEVTRHAYWEEFYPGDGGKGFMWRKMPHVMLSKCAEAQALRAAFPADLSGLYADEEMMQADAVEVASTVRRTSEPGGHDVATEVQRWRLGVRDAFEAAEDDKLNELKSRWGKIDPKLPPLDKIDNMRDMRRVCTLVKSVLRVDVHPVDALPDEKPDGPADPVERDEQGEPREPIQDRDPREDTIDVPSRDVSSDAGEQSSAGASSEAPTPPASAESPGETTGSDAGAPADEPLDCAAGDGPIAVGEHAVWSEDGKPYHIACGTF